MFRVEWRDVALNELAAIWMAASADRRSAITQATNLIDQKLRTDPVGSSESREGSDRILFEPPLGIEFRLNPSARTVMVGHIWSYTTRSR
jgi:hypothetical protein